MFIVPIARMDGIVPSDSQKSSPAKGQAGPVPFKEMLRTAVKEADQAMRETQEMDIKLASGQVDNLHTALIQAEKSAAAVEFTTQLASKAVNAYNQIMGMQV